MSVSLTQSAGESRGRTIGYCKESFIKKEGLLVLRLKGLLIVGECVVRQCANTSSLA